MTKQKTYKKQLEKRDVFLSHRSANSDIVRPIVAMIEAEQYKNKQLMCWFDEAEIKPGESIPGAITKGLEQSRFFAIAMTPEYFAEGSGWTDAEWHSALHADPDNRKVNIIPLLLADCPYVPALLRHLNAIDCRGSKLSDGMQKLLSVLREEPLPRPTKFRGQLVNGAGLIDRQTLIAELSVSESFPDEVAEELYCNLLPINKLPTYIYTAAIGSALITTTGGKDSMPSKDKMKTAIRANQERLNNQYMPAFRLLEDRLVSFHDLSTDSFAGVVDDHDVETINTQELLTDEDDRKIVIALLNMAISRHAKKLGLTVDNQKHGRFFFPPKDGKAQVITWKPSRKLASRTVAKPCINKLDGTVSFWRHQGAYLRTLFLANKFYVQIDPTWVITEDGDNLMQGPNVSRLANRWTLPERNLQILYHVRFWSKILNTGAGPISIRAGDQWLEVAPIPAYVSQTHGIAGDRKDLLMELDEQAPTIAQNEDDYADSIADYDTEDSVTDEGVNEEVEGADFEE